MTSWTMNHLWQSTLCVPVAWVLTLAMRRNRAAVRYGVWLAASLKFVVPFALLVSAGQLGWRPAANVPQTAAKVMDQIGQSFGATEIVLSPVTVPAENSSMPLILWAVWFCGAAIVAGRWARAWCHIHTISRSATPIDLELEIPARESRARMEPGVFGVWRPVLLLPEGIAGRLTADQFAAVLAHELAHVRRRDNLTAALHMIVETIFWFHPLVWWIGRRLLEERERACDEEVLRTSRDPESYAEGILNVCRLYLCSPRVCVPGVTGADLKKRIQFIVSNVVTRRMSTGRKMLLATAGTVLVAGPLLTGMLHPVAGRAQEKRPVFDVASVKHSGLPVGSSSWDSSPAGTLRMKNETLRNCIMIAYGVKDTQVAGGPKWIDSEGYNIDAKAPHPAKDPELLQMLQELLAERFSLAFHRESRMMEGYALVVAKGGLKIKPAAAGNKNQLNSHGGHVTAQNVSMARLSGLLARMMGASVADETRVAGEFDFTLDITGENGAAQAAVSPADEAQRNPAAVPAPGNAAREAALISALREQLGLTMETRRVSTQVLVIDRAERPTEN